MDITKLKMTTYKYDSQTAGYAIIVNGKCIGRCGTPEGAKAIVASIIQNEKETSV